MKKIELKNNWKFRIANSSTSFVKFKRWMNCEVPGTVHTDLLYSGLIEDPFYEDNEKGLQWIGEQNWDYKTSFDLPNNFEPDNPTYLVFDGVDTIAEAWLNKKPVGKFQNMFRKYEFDVTKKLKMRNNLLEIKFQSPIKYVLEQEKKYGQLHNNINSKRVYLRKAQYSFGWDWGPSFPTSGLWKPVYVEQRPDIRIKNISFNTLEIKKGKAIVELKIFISGALSSDLLANVSLNYIRQLSKKTIINLNHKNNLKIEILNPQVWWPNGTGEQPLYNLKVELKDSKGRLLDKIEKKVGIRKIDLILKNKKLPTFKFVINNKDIFIKGVNWIPADSFLPRVSKRQYERIILTAKEANCNMIRVWGGGVYEPDYFYELCDDHGILIWQDFMFACGVYPEHKEFIDNIKNEIEQQVERLQFHPSLALWCGNNENEWIWYQTEEKPIEKMSGFRIFHDIIPKIVNEIDPERAYWPSSPFGNNEDPNDQESGNTHQWNIWSKWIDYARVTEDNSLFVTEFGFQAPANIHTLEKCLSQKHRKIQDEKFEFHNKQVEGQERVFKFLTGHLPISSNWKDFNYLTQLNQGMALKYCIDHWRANRLITNGSIIWQLNDCWPVVSWSLVDSGYLPKISYYFVKKAFAPVRIFFKRENSILKVFGLNEGLVSVKGYVKLVIFNTSSGEVIHEITKKALLKVNSYNPVIIIPRVYQKNAEDYYYVITIYNEKDELITRNYYSSREWKHIQIPKSKISIKRGSSKMKNEILITTNSPAYFVDLYHPKMSFSDRGFILLPGEEKTLKTTQNSNRKIDIKDIEVFSLNNFLSDDKNCKK